MISTGLGFQPQRGSWLWALVLPALALFSLGCTRDALTCTPADLQGCVVDRVSVTGNQALSDDEIVSRISTAETGGPVEGLPILGGVDSVTSERERFDRFVLERDLQRVARLYRAQGYYEANVKAGRVFRIDERRTDLDQDVRVMVEIVVDEGKPVRLRSVDLRWKGWDPLLGDPAAGAAATDAKNDYSVGRVFDEASYEAARRALQRALTDRGFAYARVESSAKVNVVVHAADVIFAIDLGPRCTFGDITIEGLDEIPDWQVRPALGISKGDAYSTEKLAEAEIALSDFGVFSSIELKPDLSNPKRVTQIPVKITAQPGALRSVRLGGGIELGGAVATRGVLGWQNKNMFGALDTFNVEARPRLVLYPWKLSTLFGAAPQLVPEIVGRLQYSLPVPYDPRTSLYVQGQASAALPQNLDTPERIDEDTNIPGEYLAEQRLGVERRFWLSRIIGGFAHSLSFTQPFSYNKSDPPGETDALLLSTLETYFDFDLRRGESGRWDSREREHGFFFASRLEFSGYVIGGDADDLKLAPEMRFFAPLAKNVTVAGRLGLGLLHTSNYGRVLDDDLSIAEVGQNQTLLAEANRDVQILSKRGLTSGGPQSNRGYSFAEIAPHRTLGDDGLLLLDPDSIGGRTRWEISVELRFPLVGDLGGTLFTDASDVTRGLGEFRIDHPHVSSGLGVRYATPVGPLRLDLGFRIPYLQVAGEANVDSCIKLGVPCESLVIDEGDASLFLGLPAALAIAIGDAF